MSPRRIASIIVFFCIIALLFTRKDTPTEALAVADKSSLRSLSSGKVVGFADKRSTHSWLGIPYAAAPLGNLRWRAPRPAPHWQGTREALAYSDMCIQKFPENYTGEPVLQGTEDCLYLNVSAPRYDPDQVPKDGEHLPVMVWIHGGGNSIGSASQYAAVRNLASHKMVVVSINYRLGLMGWLSHPALRDEQTQAQPELGMALLDVTNPEQAQTAPYPPELMAEVDQSGNYGTLDTIQALRWVQQNITAFGGDPENVTVFGESAGGVNVFALLASPLAKDLFHRAIVQSGIPYNATIEDAENYADDELPGMENGSRELINRLLIADAQAANRAQAKSLQDSMPLPELRNLLYSKTSAELYAQAQPNKNSMIDGPWVFRDGTVLPIIPMLEVFSDPNQYNAVPTIIGTNREEYKSLMVTEPDYVKRLFGMIPAPRDQVVWDQVGQFGGAMWKAIGADEPARQMVSGGHQEVYVYRLDWDDPPTLFMLLNLKNLLGASHALDMPLIFTDYDNEMTFMPFELINEDNITETRPLAEAMAAYWAEFAYSGKPATGRNSNAIEWQAWQVGDDSEQFMVFDTVTDGGIRMADTSLDRAAVRQWMIDEMEAIGGQQALCTLYINLFYRETVFKDYLWRDEDFTALGCQLSLLPKPRTIKEP